MLQLHLAFDMRAFEAFVTPEVVDETFDEVEKEVVTA